MNSDTLREKFLSYFENLNHQVVASSPVIPRNDPTLLFANAGMNQFKEVFLGNEVRSYKRATSIQKCIRAGGKHNDLDEVGKDGRHLTFFEMLGNWSFGDYGKPDALRWAWEFLTQQLGLNPDHLYVSIYKDDEEAFSVWHDQIGLAPERIARFGDIERGDEENFWSMGPTGACGPCSEIYIDLHPEGPMLWGPGFPDDRYLELWNVVFMQFERAQDGSLTRLPMCSVDTGMGMERILSVLQHVDSVYETDLFKAILEKTAALLGKNLTQKEILNSEDSTAYRVIADHIRTLTFAISEGQPFANDGRGYVLRRILRRAVRFGRMLGFHAPFLCKVSQAVVDTFAKAYPEIALVAAQTQEVIRLEEERFFATIDRGIARFEEVVAKAKNGKIDGRDAFILYDTYGFPLDLTQIMAQERHMDVDVEGFNGALNEQRQRSSEKAKFYANIETPWTILQEGRTSQFEGYGADACQAHILRYRQSGDICEIILDHTPFYAECGGEVGDHGSISACGVDLVFDVLDTIRGEGGIVHICQVREGFVTEDAMKNTFRAAVDPDFRARVSANHTCTHLLQAALRKLVSSDIYQAGSLVRPDRFRFDFTFPRALTPAELQNIETHVNGVIRKGLRVIKHADVPIDEAKKMGAMAIFGEKYGEKVRVIEVEGGESIELCGGIHVDNTRDIETFRIVSESAIAAGVRRIECLTRQDAMALYESERRLAVQIEKLLHCDKSSILPKIEKLLAANAALEKELDAANLRVAQNEIENILKDKREIKGFNVYAAKLRVGDKKALLTYGDILRDKMTNGVAMLGAIVDGKPALTCVVSEDAVKNGLHAGKIVSACAAIIGGKGGGRPNAAQAGGADAEKLGDAIMHVYDAI